jgi:predicted transposase/invertase (TIGR01784 family)
MELFSPKEDLVFKLLFGDARHIELLTAFLQAVLPLPKDEYAEVALMPPALPTEYPLDKLSILDVKVKTKHGALIDVEIQVANQSALRQRILYYAARMITEQIGEAGKYEEIQPVITILITDFVLIRENAKYHNHYRLHDPETGSTFTEHLEIHVLELPKVREDDHTTLWDWLGFLKAESEEELAMLASKNEEVKKAVTRLIELSADETARAIREAQAKARRDHFAQLASAREEGEALGRKEGEARGQKEGEARGQKDGEARGRRATAQSLLRLGIPLETIIAATGLSGEEILALRTDE